MLLMAGTMYIICLLYADYVYFDDFEEYAYYDDYADTDWHKCLCS